MLSLIINIGMSSRRPTHPRVNHSTEMQKIHLASTALALLLPSISHAAALLGITEPGWDRTGGSAGHAAWEWWDTTTGQFTHLAPDQSLGTTSYSPTLTQSGPAIGVSSGANTSTGLPGRLTSGGLGSQYDFTLTDTALAPITTILVQIKHSNFLDANFEEVLSPFTVSVNGGTPVSGTKNPNGTTSPENYRWESSDGGTATGGTGVFFWTYSYLLTDLDIQQGESYAVDFSSLPDTSGFGFSLDTVSIDVQYASSVPEPASLMVASLILPLGCLVRRRNRHSI